MAFESIQCAAMCAQNQQFVLTGNLNRNLTRLHWTVRSAQVEPHSVDREFGISVETRVSKIDAVLTTHICHGSIRLQDTDNEFLDAVVHSSSNG